MEYNFIEIENKWRQYWEEKKTYKTVETNEKEKFYVLDMFPYPSGAGLHVGHPLGYIASDVIARYKRHQGYNVLHPMGYDSFGLPAEQYAIETGQHPELTTKNNIATYRSQLNKIGFSYDWDREVRTSDPKYYKWTQWIFCQLFNSWYNKNTNKAEPISELVKMFEENGTYNVDAVVEEAWWKNLPEGKFALWGERFEGVFTATDWSCLTEEEKDIVLMNYRLTFLSESWVNWCPALGTVLANDEIKDGLSERGGHPVERKKMWQWSMRITAYAERLLQGLETIDWTDSLKEIQKNWIGKSQGAELKFDIDGHEDVIEVFTTRPDTIFGVSFVVLAPEHELVSKITSKEYQSEVNAYVEAAGLKSERDRQSNVKEVSGQFIGAYAIHPITEKKIPIWIADYVLTGYGTGAIMAVPAGDQRDWDFASKFRIPIPSIFEDVDISEKACEDKGAVLKNSEFLDGLEAKEAIQKAITFAEKKNFGIGKTNYRLRDAIFSRQRYWGEPIPVYFKNEVPHLLEFSELPLTLPPVDKYLPTETGEPPLARAEKSAWPIFKGDRMEYNTMPGWAGSSWYFLRYMDSDNDDEFCSREKSDYWGQVDLYMGGAEHATGHLLYSRFWTKVLFDLGHIGFDEPFAKLINQGMILGRSSFIYRIVGEDKIVTFEERKNFKTQRLHININLVDNDVLNIEEFRSHYPQYAAFEIITNDKGEYVCGSEVEKMSKRWHNVVNPDDLVEKYGADTLRCYEMFLGPVEQSKPWDTKGITGSNNFLRKALRLFQNGISEDQADKKALKSIHKTIKKVTEDLDRFSWNTVVSALMICVNELTELKCNNREVLKDFATLLSPYAPHLAEEMWCILNEKGSVVDAVWPSFNTEHLIEDEVLYPVSFNGKMKFKINLPAGTEKSEIEKFVLSNDNTIRILEGKTPKRVIVVPGKIVNIVI